MLDGANILNHVVLFSVLDKIGKYRDAKGEEEPNKTSKYRDIKNVNKSLIKNLKVKLHRMAKRILQVTITMGVPDSSVGITTRTGWTVRGSNRAWGEIFRTIQIVLEAHPTF